MSHNRMATSPSTTDLNTLKEEGNTRNHFLSLIVNNAGSYSAAITRKVKTITKGTQIIEYNTFNDIHIEGDEVEEFEEEDTYVEYFPLTITVEEATLEKSELELRLDAVRASSKSYINNKNFSANKSKEPKQLTLFNFEDYDKDAKEDDSMYSDIDYDSETVGKEVVKNTILQIITGDIFSIYKSTIDIHRWAANMENLYNKRFKDDFQAFGFWADTLLETLENEVPVIKGKDKDYSSAVWAYEVLKELENYPSNKYLDYFKESIERWMLL